VFLAVLNSPTRTCGPPEFIKLATHACLLLHNFCISRGGDVLDTDVDQLAELETSLDFHTSTVATAAAAAADADDTMDAVADGFEPASSDDDDGSSMLSNGQRQQLIAQAGWELYQRAAPDRARRRALVAVALDFEARGRAYERVLTARAQSHLSNKRRPGKRSASARDDVGSLLS
jgi:hypothetical protein